MAEETDVATGTDGSQPGDNNQSGDEDKSAENPEQESGIPDPIMGEDIIPAHRGVIPEKYKTYGALVKAVTESEKRMSRAITESGKYKSAAEKSESLAAEYERKIAEFENNKLTRETNPAKGQPKEMTPEEFRQLMYDDPEKYFSIIAERKAREIFDAQQKQINQEQTQRQREESIKKEIDDYITQVGDEKFKEILPELKRIKQERPYLERLEDIVAVYEKQQKVKENINSNSDRLKDPLKSKAIVETDSGRKPAITQTAMEELEAIRPDDPQAEEKLRKLASRINK